MAVSATIALSSATIAAMKQVVATISLTQNTAGSLIVTSVAPLIQAQNGAKSQSCAVASGTVPIGANFDSTIPGTGLGTLKLSFPITANAPTTDMGTNVAQPGSQVIVVGAIIQTSDGVVTYATPANLTVTDPGVA